MRTAQGEQQDRQPQRQAVEIDGHRLVLTHLDRLLFPATGHTKAHLLHYYAQIAAVMVVHTAGRPASFVRAPEGPEGQSWVAKNPPPGTPEWITVAEVPGREGPARHVVVDSPAAVVAMANLGAFEMHVPQWTTEGGPELHDRLVLDLDPGDGVDIVACCRVAHRLRQLLADDGLVAYPVVSGGKGLHLYVPLCPAPSADVTGYAKALATRLRAERPDQVVVTMVRAARTGRVLIDWSQNSSAKTTAAPYTLRIRERRPSVAAPLTWDEVDSCTDPREPQFSPEQVVERVSDHGDLLAGLADPARACRLRFTSQGGRDER
ncbi:non-homologous end-joining DNA ligase [Streptomyces sp. RB6PN25]|uniref:Non-homologous end-joining DNA ligase n=1 Tax=Streptomyces humicola TaxID=2953240 RepID=A0ABT1PQM4_9ACTN|nr:non-homologous end-joining DNA ligase [Streptomyces humicola]MCQ4079980.1 non-homologous end-joining DNA ligase [Streptomyces humicola]